MTTKGKLRPRPTANHAPLEMRLPDLTLEQALETLSMVPALFCNAGFDGRIRWLAGNWQEALGYTEVELIALSTYSLVHPDDVDRTMTAMGGLEAGACLKDFENRLRHKLGHYEWVRWNSRATTTHLASVAVIFTQERAQRQALQEQTELLLLAERLDKLGHWRLDLVTNELRWSDEVYRIHGMDPSHAQPDVATAVRFYHPDDAVLVDQYVNASIASGTPYDFELRLTRQDGVERIVHSLGQVEYDSEGQPATLHGTFQDVTDARMIQQRLQDGDRLASVSLLAAGIAHEINNPLQYVFANIGLAQEKLETLSQKDNPSWAQDIKMLLDDAMHGSKQVARIVRDLKSFMSARTNGDATVDLNEVIKTTLNMTRSEVRHRAKMVESMGPMPKVKADYAELIQVFINLLTNAADAIAPLGPERARIRLNCHTDEHGWAVIEIEDNGPGIEPQDHVRIFEPFFTTKPPGVGSGLGLHISRGIIERRGGTLTLRSTPGLTIFQVRLPPVSQEKQSTVTMSTSKRILVVDDDPRVARTVARMLSKEYACQVETDPRVALELLTNENFDAVVCDVMMPGMTGWELVILAQAQKPGILDRVLLMSGASPELHRPPGAPALPVVLKPFGPADLRESLSVILKES
ncbi:MAG: signal transduction histidine kinase/CheY-like chemotaxis protein [Cognaticolwellia sp.]